MLSPYSKIKIWTPQAAAVWGANSVSVQLFCRGFEAEWPFQSQWIAISISVTSEGKSKRRGSYAKFSPHLVTVHYRFHWERWPSSIEPGCGLFVCSWNIGKWACPNGWPLNVHACIAVDHAKYKTTKIYSQGNYMKICTNEIFLLYGI